MLEHFPFMGDVTVRVKWPTRWLLIAAVHRRQMKLKAYECYHDAARHWVQKSSHGVKRENEANIRIGIHTL